MKQEWIKQIDKTWALFLDRDGVINVEKEGDYVRNKDEFHFISNAPEAIAQLSRLFGRIVIVTNQKGIGKGLMTEDDLAQIHDHLIQEVEKHGGKIDRIYYCSSIDPGSPCRKPNNGMALQAKHDFPEINFSRSVMIGNTLSDMRFGKSCGMYTVFILSMKPVPALPHTDIDQVEPSLYRFANGL